MIRELPITGLYKVAMDICHQQGMDYHDPRTGKKYPAPKPDKQKPKDAP